MRLKCQRSRNCSSKISSPRHPSIFAQSMRARIFWLNDAATTPPANDIILPIHSCHCSDTAANTTIRPFAIAEICAINHAQPGLAQARPSRMHPESQALRFLKGLQQQLVSSICQSKRYSKSRQQRPTSTHSIWRHRSPRPLQEIRLGDVPQSPHRHPSSG